MSVRVKNEIHFTIPDLRVLAAESLVPHEHADWRRVSRLEARLRNDGYLKNPPIVAPIPGTDKYVVLDGANRAGAIANLGWPHILAQVVDYNSQGVKLLTWHHLITGRSPATFLEEIQAVPGLDVRPATLEEARRGLAAREILAYIAAPMENGGQGTEENIARASMVYTVKPLTKSEKWGDTALLNALVNTYKGDPLVNIHRVSSDEIEELLGYYDGVSGLVVFPPYSPDDIMRLAMTGARVPTGITRHIISPRALRVNAPMELLSGSGTLDEKNAWWHEETKRKLAANHIRLYQEATYLFDE